MANISGLLAVGLIIGAFAGSVVLGTFAVVPAGAADTQIGAAGSNSGSHGSCVASYVQTMLETVHPGPGFGDMIRAMARRC